MVRLRPLEQGTAPPISESAAKRHREMLRQKGLETISFSLGCSCLAHMAGASGLLHERLENLVLKIIRQDTEDYADRVTSCSIAPTLELMNEQYKQYIDQIIQNDNHCLHKNVLKYKPAAPTRPTPK